MSKDIVSPIRVGNKVFIRTVTHYHTGKIEAVSEHEIVLSSAAWIADTGRFHVAMKTGELKEIEPFSGPVSINRGSIIDITVWNHELPTKAQ